MAVQAEKERSKAPRVRFYSPGRAEIGAVQKDPSVRENLSFRRPLDVRGAVALVLAAVTLLAACGSGLPYRRVRPAVAFEMLHDSPKLLIVDLRPEDQFESEQGHLNGAVNIPLGEFEERWVEIAGFTETSFLVYCQGDECGEEAMMKLRECGFDYAVLIEGGLEAWRNERFGTVVASAEPAVGED